DAQRDRRRAMKAPRHLAQGFELGLGFHVEGENALAQRMRHLGACLADPGEDDLVRRHARRPRTPELAFRYHVHASAEAGQGGDDGLVGVGLDGITDERVEASEGLDQDAIVALQGRRCVAIERRANLLSDVEEAHALRVEDAAGVAEMVHFAPVSGSAGPGWRAYAAPAEAGQAYQAGRCRSR